MHVATLRLVLCLMVCSDVQLTSSEKPQTDSIVQSELVRKAREIRQHRRVRQAGQPGLNQEETKCRYKIALLDFPPYIMNQSKQQGFMNNTLTWFVDSACFRRKSNDPIACIMEPVFVQTQDEMVKLIKNNSVDFGFPVLSDARQKLTGLKSVTLIRAFVSSGCSMIVNLKICEAESQEQLLTSITSQWPILACVILLSGISGVIIWLLEHRSNAAHFSPSFTLGPPDGFWWAVVSLTTVGYGDKTPKTLCGRAFGIMWILIGAIMLSLFTALFTNAMQASLDGTRCRDIGGKDVGVSNKNPETHIVAKELDADFIKFKNLDEMQRNLSQGTIGRVLVDRNTAFYFLDKSGLKRNRQIRMIRNIDYPMEYYLAHVSHEVMPPPSGSPNDTDESADDVLQRKKNLSTCGGSLKALSSDLVAVAKDTAKENLIPAELQTADLSDEMEGLFSTGSQMTKDILFALLGMFAVLIIMGKLWEVYTNCKPTVRKKRKGLIPSSRKMSMMQNFLDLEERLKDITSDLQKLKEEFEGAANGLSPEGSLEYSKPKERSFFNNMLDLNGKSKNTETIL
ncbi:uncharacterized protein LOC111329323 [Stylophora pistillata]|uniref:uncharacterized protein LOC111329323 n=1 Tax=Stylophora pistillata TaxID=50429 RepID=UPI000C050A83|nr:uncharacterized protein LOC111329323 [Stylophora pistillata]